MSSTAQGFCCPGYGSVYISECLDTDNACPSGAAATGGGWNDDWEVPDDGDPATDPGGSTGFGDAGLVNADGTLMGSGGSWIKLPHTKTWSLNINEEEASRCRTDGTEGKRVITCPSFIDGATVDVESMCRTNDYVYCYLFPTATCQSAGGGAAGPFTYLDIGNPKRLWFYFSANSRAVGGQPDAATFGFYALGTAIPAGYEVDNDSNDALRLGWKVDVLEGPFFAASGLCGNISAQVDLTRGE